MMSDTGRHRQCDDVNGGASRTANPLHALVRQLIESGLRQVEELFPRVSILLCEMAVEGLDRGQKPEVGGQRSEIPLRFLQKRDHLGATDAGEIIQELIDGVVLPQTK